ncbi:hypothetical protein SRHO_G00327140 [Serrasalmus rhombeus]
MPSLSVAGCIAENCKGAVIRCMKGVIQGIVAASEVWCWVKKALRQAVSCANQTDDDYYDVLSECSYQHFLASGLREQCGAEGMGLRSVEQSHSGVF